MDGRTGGQTDGQMEGCTDVRTDGKSPHSTGLRPLSGPLPKKRDKGTADHMMPLGDWFCPEVEPYGPKCVVGSTWILTR